MFTIAMFSESGPDISLVWLLYAVFGIFFLVVVVGWLTSHQKGSQVEAGHEAQKSAKKETDAPVKAEEIDPKVIKGNRKAK